MHILGISNVPNEYMRRSIMKSQRRGCHTACKVKTISILVIGMLFVVLFNTATAAKFKRVAKITITAKSTSMYQEAAIPEYKAAITCSGHMDIVLDGATGYTVKELIRDLKNKNGYTITSNTDGITEGSSPLVITLSDELKNNLQKKWAGKVEIQSTNAKIIVKNKYGEWDKDKFVRPDGTNVVNDWVISKNNTYYFNNDGIKVTGWADIGPYKYYFDKTGIRKTGWLDLEGSKYYFNSDGTMAVGWLELEGQKFYTDDTGKMVTGECQIGSKKCIFGADGILQSWKDSLDLTKPMMALTFDDGPGKNTEQILAVLEQYGAHATFFMLGNKIPQYPETIKHMDAIGCEIGNHTMSHAYLSKLSGAEIISEVGGVNDELSAILGHKATVMRPPWGAVNDTVKANVGMPLVLWSIDTLDWKTKNTQATIDNVLNTASDGDIVLMHDIHDTTVAAAVALIPQLISRGYQLVTVTELAEARGTSMQKGVSYFDFYQ